jgi:hypothetical protein
MSTPTPCPLLGGAPQDCATCPELGICHETTYGDVPELRRRLERMEAYWKQKQAAK